MVNSWQKKMKSLSPNQFENQEPMKDREAMSDYDSDRPDTIRQKIAMSINKKTIKIANSWEEKKPKLKQLKKMPDWYSLKLKVMIR